jgi:hypothetical protein
MRVLIKKILFIVIAFLGYYYSAKRNEIFTPFRPHAGMRRRAMIGSPASLTIILPSASTAG